MEMAQEVVVRTGFIDVGPKDAPNSTVSTFLAPYNSDTINESQWSPAKILGREQLIARANWPVTAIAFSDLEITSGGDTLYSLQVPFDLWRNTASQTLLETFTYYRCDFVVTITVNGSKFHSGLLVPFFTPLSLYPAPLVSAMALEHSMIEANGVHSGVLRIPFRCPKDYLSTYESPGVFTLGNITLRVLSGLTAATGSATEIPITITFHCENVQMYVPAIRATDVLPTAFSSARVAEKQQRKAIPARTATPHTNSVANTKRVPGEMHMNVAADAEQVDKSAETTKAPAVDRLNPKCVHNPFYDSPESIRDVLKRSSAVGSGDLIWLGSLQGVSIPVGVDTSRHYSMGYFDAGCIFNAQTSTHPASYWASMYSLGRGSLRYTITFNNAASGNSADQFMYGAMFLPGAFYPNTYATASREVSETRAQAFILPGTGYATSTQQLFDQAGYEMQPLLDALNFLPRRNIGQFGTTHNTWKQFFSNATSGAAVALADVGHNQVTLDIPFVSRYNAYQMPRYSNTALALVDPPNNYVAVTNNGPYLYDDVYDNNIVPGSAKGGQNSYCSQDATYGPHMSPGVIVLFCMFNTDVTSLTPTSSHRINASVFASIGDDFRFGVIRGFPMGGSLAFNPRSQPTTVGKLTTFNNVTTVPQFNAFGLITDGFPPREGTVGGEPLSTATTFVGFDLYDSPVVQFSRSWSFGGSRFSGVPHGNTITTINKFKKAANVTLPMEVNGDKFDTTANLKTTMMDKPSNTLTGMPIVPQLTSPLPNSTGIVNATRMALRADETYEASPELFGTEEDEMDLCYLTRKLTLAADACNALGSGNQWTTSLGPGEWLFQIPISPLPFDSQFNTSSTYIPSLISLVSSHFLYWSGALRYRFKVVASAFHTGRLFFSVSYHSSRDYKPVDGGNFIQTQTKAYGMIPQTLTEALNQGGVFLDLSEESRDIVIDVPYKAAYPRLDVPTGFQPHQKSAMGYITCWVVNPLVAPENVSPSVDYLTFIGGGPDFQLYTLSPFAAMMDAPRPVPQVTGVSADVLV